MWTGARDFKGYGKVTVTGEDGKLRHRGAHKLAWELEHGPVPKGLEVDHKTNEGCVGRLCLVTEHMHLVTKRENVLLMWARIRAAGWKSWKQWKASGVSARG